MSVELESVKYSKVDNINSKEIKVSPAKSVVFRRYIDYLTINDNKKRIHDFNPGRYHIYTFPIVPGISNSVKWKWDKESDKDIYYLSQYKGTDIGCLKTVTFLTVDKDTLTPSNKSYEKLFDIPVSAWLFSTRKNFDSYIKDDYNYTAYNYNPVASRLNRKNYEDTVLKPNNFNFNYWGQTYDFGSGYNNEDYLLYGITETTFEDSQTEMTSLPCDYEIKKMTTKSAAIVVAYHADDIIIPVTYAELHNSFYTPDGIIRIEWSQNGIITIV